MIQSPAPQQRGKGGLPYQKDWDAHRKFWKELQRGTRTLFCGRGLNFFQPLEVPIQKQHIASPVIVFRFNALKGTPKPSAVDPLRIENPKRYRNYIFKPWKLKRAPKSFCLVVSQRRSSSVGDLTDHYHPSNIEQGLTFKQKTSYIKMISI